MALLLSVALLTYGSQCMIETEKFNFLPALLLFNLGAQCDELSCRCHRTAVPPGRDMGEKDELLKLADQVIYDESLEAALITKSCIQLSAFFCSYTQLKKRVTVS